jgi:hypothetical protein
MNLLRIGKRPRARAERVSTGRYRSRPGGRRGKRRSDLIEYTQTGRELTFDKRGLELGRPNDLAFTLDGLPALPAGDDGLHCVAGAARVGGGIRGREIVCRGDADVVAELAGGHGGRVRFVCVHAVLSDRRQLPSGDGGAGDGGGMRDRTADGQACYYMLTNLGGRRLGGWLA